MDIVKLYLFVCLTILILEFISKKNLRKVFMMKPCLFMANSLLLLDIFLLFSLLSQVFHVTIIVVTLILIILGIANRIKIDYRQTGFTPLDFLIFREAKSMAGALNKKSMLLLAVTSLISAVLLFGLTWILQPIQINGYLKGFIIVISLTMLILFYTLGPKYNQSISVFKVGTIIYFLSYLNDPPRIRISGRKRNLPLIEDIGLVKADVPDVIVIQSESFVDPFELGKENFNKDPLPFYRSLCDEAYSFSMSTRAFGGGTVHTEYEILTGLSTVFFPRDTTVFSRYIKEPLPSLGSILKKQGYDSLLIHPYLEWYYNRTKVYKKLGFDKFLSLKSFHTESIEYVKDIEVFKRITQELDNGNNLVVAVTMQNHTPYNNDLHNNGVEYLGSFRNTDTKKHFNNFLNGLGETDKALSFLIEELKNRDKETILLFYGDHLPVVNQDAAFYEESKWSAGDFDSWKYYYDLSKSPGFIWSNKRLIKGTNKYIDATSVLPILLKEINCDYPEYLKNLADVFENKGYNGLFRDFVVRNNMFYGSRHPEYIKIFKTVRAINDSAFNDASYDEWCFENDAYEVN